jgi:hypothetical protein
MEIAVADAGEPQAVGPAAKLGRHVPGESIALGADLHAVAVEAVDRVLGDRHPGISERLGRDGARGRCRRRQHVLIAEPLRRRRRMGEQGQEEEG